MTIRLKLPEHKRRQKYLKGDKNDICKTAMKAVCPLFLTCSLHRKGTLSWKISSTRLLFKEPGGKPFCLKCITQDYTFTSFTDGDSGKVSPMQETHKRLGLDPWIGKITWRRERLPTPAFWPREFPGLYSPWGHRVRHDWATFIHFHLALSSFHYSYLFPWILPKFISDVQGPHS